MQDVHVTCARVRLFALAVPNYCTTPSHLTSGAYPTTVLQIALSEQTLVRKITAVAASHVGSRHGLRWL